MREVASRGTIELDELFDYVINGINDEQNNKIILYGAKTIREFKDKLKLYKKMKKGQPEKATKYLRNCDEPTKHAGKKFSWEDTKKRIFDGQESGLRCFNCGINGHYAKYCNRKSLGKKCFSCNKFGHEAKNCEEGKRNRSNPNSKQAVNLVNVSLTNVTKI